jgi:arylsulfatase A-like enzyme
MPRRHRWIVVAVLALIVAAVAPSVAPGASAQTAAKPNIFFYNLDDLRDAFPGGIDPLQFMPKTRAWMSTGTRYAKSFVVEPSCCPSRSALMTGRFPHNNGVLLQSQGPAFDSSHSMACYLRSAGYATYMAGKFLTTWPRTQTPPCFDHSTVMWGGYNDVGMRTDGVWRSMPGYTTTVLGVRGREYITSALGLGKPFLLYEAPQAPHWAEIQNPDGTTSRLAVPEPRYASAAVGTCSGVPETDRSDKPPYVRSSNFSQTSAQQMCQSQLRAIMSADDQFDATMQLLSDRGVLANTLVIFSSDNGYMWGEHGRTEKFVPYEPAIRVPLLIRWPGHFSAGVDTTRTVSYLDILPTILQAAGFTLPASAPRLDGESLLGSSSRTSSFAEYWRDSDNDASVPMWKMVRTSTAKYIQTYDDNGAVIFREYYNLANDPAENTNLLADGNPANDPSPAQVTTLTNLLNAYATCAGTGCLQTSTPDTAIFADDFSTGTFANWTGVTRLTIDNASGAPTAPSVRGTPVAQSAFAFRSLSATYSSACLSVRVNAGSLGGSGVALFRLRTASDGPISRAFVNASGMLNLRSDVSGAQVNSGVNLGSGWHSVELCGTVGSATSWDLYRDGVRIVNGWVANTGTTPIGRIQIGDAAAKTWTINFDDVRLDQAPG